METLRKEYGSNFASGYRSDARLGSVLELEGVENFDQLVKKNKKRKIGAILIQFEQSVKNFHLLINSIIIGRFYANTIHKRGTGCSDKTIKIYPILSITILSLII